MREYRFDPEGELPIIRARLEGPKGQVQATLVFDSGCSLTQVHDQLLENIGLGKNMSLRDLIIGGVHGEGDSSYQVAMPAIRVLGKRFSGIEIAGVDFSKWAPSGIEGLLGWDLIRTFHFDIDGPKGLLKVF